MDATKREPVSAGALLGPEFISDNVDNAKPEISMTSIKTMLCWLAAFALFCQVSARAQLITTVGTSPIQFGVDSHALLFDTGTYGTGTLSLSGAGTRMLWYPGKAAFRAGNVTGTEWNDSNIGSYSAAFGQDTVASDFSFASGYQSSASGDYSIAMGYQSTATADYSTALGYQASATGGNSTALGYETDAIGAYSVSMGAFNHAYGLSSTAIGTEASTSGYFSVSIGYSTDAGGFASTALGGLTYASGSVSTAMGNGTWATGDSSTAMGLQTIAGSYLSTVIGTLNLNLSETGAAPNLTSWIGTDPLFEIGNGTSTESGSDAVAVFKNGNMKVQGVITCAPGGDIPMFTGL